jgi:hypothetical protein
LKGVSKANHAAPIDISFALVPRLSYLVKIPKNKPPNPLRRLEVDELGEELFFQRLGQRILFQIDIVGSTAVVVNY